jgi:hypothetical protein
VSICARERPTERNPHTYNHQSSIQSEVAPLLKEGNKVDALKKIVTASSALNSAPEKGVFLPFY